MSNNSSVTIIAISLLFSQAVLLNNIIVITVRGDPNTTIVDFECCVDRWGQNDPYGAVVTEMINDLVRVCPTAPDRDLYVGYSAEIGGQDIAFGDAECRDGVSESDCRDCLGQARQNMITGCPCSLFVRVLLGDCALRYDDHPFHD